MQLFEGLGFWLTVSWGPVPHHMDLSVGSSTEQLTFPNVSAPEKIEETLKLKGFIT